MLRFNIFKCQTRRHSLTKSDQQATSHFCYAGFKMNEPPRLARRLALPSWDKRDPEITCYTHSFALNDNRKIVKIKLAAE